MDEKESVINTGDLLPPPDDVYRIALIKDRDRKNKSIPAVRCFSLSPHDDYRLSVDWEKRTTPEECMARVGATYKMHTTQYKDYQNREIYALNVAFLNSLIDIDKVIYAPVILDIPEKGRINNPAHSLVVFSLEYSKDQAKEPETLLKIRDHAKDKRVEAGKVKVEELVKNYRTL